ncbi:TSUP family transporter [Corynebacterium sp. zg254]|uniref:Probable membrane transporter protein n=1 Tax=Corynebacterium zhongnanshanii TaxID=2768834 RepID=A0ABQ6VF95_9CORY|nr:MULTISPECIES: TSUP family transporter [Corynebacterium]KAB3520961.1 TSUP family transporter [Corynebacterium zhongnanshanii]MCR5914592.1 TSUP family transporter [Corynebacterium sp. zg254]
MSIGTLSLLVGGSLVAGFVDALIGGGGLILIPLLLIAAPGMPATSALATNKVAGISGTASAAVAMLRRVPVDRHLLYRAVPLAALCSAAGALLASSLSSDVLRPIVIVLLLAVGVYVTFRPTFGADNNASTVVTRGRWVAALLLVAVIAGYDGFFGPGTGMFLIIIMTALLNRSFVESAAMTKVINTATNLGALVVFAVGGHVWWLLGVGLAIANIAGAQLGARLVIAKGTGLVRVALLTLVVVMTAKLTWDMLH